MMISVLMKNSLMRQCVNLSGHQKEKIFQADFLLYKSANQVVARVLSVGVEATIGNWCERMELDKGKKNCLVLWSAGRQSSD